MRTTSKYHVSSSKLFLISVLLFTLFPSTIQAQLLIGGEIGGARATLTTPNNLAQGATWNFRSGLSAGVFLDFPISGDLRLQPEIQYIQKGMNVVVSLSDPSSFSWKTAVTNSYVELPLYLKYSLGGNYLHWFVLGGPDVGYLLSSNSEVTESPLRNGNYDSKYMYKSYDLTICIGVGFEYPLSSSYYLVPALRYYHGVIKVEEPPSGTINETSQCYSRTVQLTIGILFPVSQ